MDFIDLLRALAAKMSKQLPILENTNSDKINHGNI